MKPLMNLMILSVLILSMLPAITAEDSALGVTSAVDMDATLNIRPNTAKLLQEAPSMDDCVRILQNNYPQANKERVEATCEKQRRMVAAEPVAVKAEVKMEPNATVKADGDYNMDAEMRARIAALAKERREKIEALNEERKEKIAAVKTENLRKLAALDSDKLEKVASLSEEEIEKLSTMDRTQLKEYAAMNEEAIKARLEKVKVERVKTTKLYQKRTVAKERVEAAKEKYEQARERYQEEKEAFSEERSAFRKAVDDGDDEAALEHAKAYLTHAADLVIESLNKVRAQVEANDNLEEDEAAEIIADIDEKIGIMEDAKADVEAAETKEELKEAAKTVRQAWERTRERIKLHAERVVKAQVGEILSRSEQLEAKLDRALTNLEEQGIEVDDLDQKLEEFSDLVNDAKEKFLEAESLLDNGETDEAKPLIREAHDNLKSAHEIVMELIREIKANGWNGNFDDDEYTNIVVDENDDDGDDSSSAVCCEALTASCLACAEDVSIEAYCKINPDTVGCEAYATIDSDNETDS